MNAWEKANHYLVEKGPGMYLIEKVREAQNANVIFCSDDELAILRELITRADDGAIDWIPSSDDIRIIGNINQALNGDD